jgi:hypothetical protein
LVFDLCHFFRFNGQRYFPKSIRQPCTHQYGHFHNLTLTHSFAFMELIRAPEPLRKSFFTIPQGKFMRIIK